MTFAIEPITSSFAAYVRGIDLRSPLDSALVSAIVKGMDKYAVMVFPDQALSEDDQVAFARQFGPLDTSANKMMSRIQAKARKQNIELSDISNVDDAGQVASSTSRQAMMNIGNRIWHTDSSFLTYPWRYSMLYCVAPASRGGETQWADLRAAYDALPPHDQAAVEHLIGEHYALQSRMLLGFTDNSRDEIEMYPPVRWPLVRTHAGSGRKLLFVTSAIREIVGMSLPEGRQLVQDLIEHVTQREFVYTHNWKPGELVIWDNRAVIHRGRRFDMTERREMRRVSTVDDVQSLSIGEESRTKIYGQVCI